MKMTGRVCVCAYGQINRMVRSIYFALSVSLLLPSHVPSSSSLLFLLAFSRSPDTLLQIIAAYREREQYAFYLHSTLCSYSSHQWSAIGKQVSSNQKTSPGLRPSFPIQPCPLLSLPDCFAISLPTILPLPISSSPPIVPIA